MKIYTGYGDQGETALFGGRKVKKHHLRVQFYGALDELNSYLGLVRSKNTLTDIDNLLNGIQNNLFTVSAEAASADDKAVSKLPSLVGKEEIDDLEKTIDKLSDELPSLKNFILPGGTETAALCHVSRSVCRRAERMLTRLMEEETIRPDVLIFLNRLSDLLFVLGRFINYKNNVNDILWQTR